MDNNHKSKEQLMQEAQMLRRQLNLLMANNAEHQKTEAAHRRLIRAIEHTAEAVIITDPQGTIEYVNPSFERMTGYSSTDVLGQNPRILKSGWHDASFYRTLWQTILAGQVWQGRLINRRKFGEIYYEEMTIAPVFNPAGEVVNFVAIKRDITERVQAEEARQREFRLLEQLANRPQSATIATALDQLPLQERLPEAFEKLVQHYHHVLDLALQQRSYKIEHHISDELRNISEQLGLLQASPRDVVELHSITLRNKIRQANTTRAQAYLEEGRLTVLELMGYLVSFYRRYYPGAGVQDIARNPPSRTNKE
ncbi:MAG: PAS domain S-box protein [Anaerolineaceae bacterium]|nr:PAS domain S-box protein [Anaerolineaceae bacterium]MCB9099482.1 PAS domain S-box protein [Anaerolineales bacterium]